MPIFPPTFGSDVVPLCPQVDNDLKAQPNKILLSYCVLRVCSVAPSCR